MLRGKKNSNKFHGMINKSAAYVPDSTLVDNLAIYCFNIIDVYVQLEGLMWLETASSTF